MKKEAKTQQADEFFPVKWLERKKLGRPDGSEAAPSSNADWLTGWLADVNEQTTKRWMRK